MFTLFSTIIKEQKCSQIYRLINCKENEWSRKKVKTSLEGERVKINDKRWRHNTIGMKNLGNNKKSEVNIPSLHEKQIKTRY